MSTREEYLNNAITEFRADFEQAGTPLPEKIRVACGWPSRGGLANRKRRVGEIWASTCSDDQNFEIFISPVLKNSEVVLATLTHELCHAAAGVEHGHKKPFKKVMKALGLEGKATATVAGEQLLGRIREIVAKLSEYPHAELHSVDKDKKKQTTRMLLVKCPACGYQVRTTAKWIEVGLPVCCCGTEMETEEIEE